MNIQGYGATVLAVSWAEGAIALSLLFARIYTTWKITRQVRLDLYLTLLTFIFAIAGVILVTVSVAYGIGTHKDDLSASDKTAAIKWGWINQALSILATSLGKLSIVAFLQQIHGPEHRGRVIGLWALATSNLVVNVVTIAIIMTQCSPPGKLWNDKLQGSCSGRQRNEAIAYFQGSWSAFCDLALALYPIVFLWSVKLRMRVKIGLCVLMGLGVMFVINSPYSLSAPT
ncbi:hypothetical protein VI817_001740 [Penicillium citrinum]|nr:hypothetical protein VI817_001740 [Penicillium citrinum]